MKMVSTGRVSLIGVIMLGSVGVSDAARGTLSVTEGGIAFTAVRYNDGRNKPYRLRFRQDGTRSLYMLDSTTRVTDIKIGEAERYQVLYDASDNLESVRLTPSTRRALAEEENDAATIGGRRLDFDDCTECEDAWVSLCAGVSSICDLVDFGSPLSTAAAASVATTCETFGSACSSYEASEACEGQCPDEVVGSSSNSCLDPTSDDFKCTFSGDTTLGFTGCDLTDDDVPFLPACFEEFGKNNIERLLLDDHLGISSYPEGIFTGLSELTFLDLHRGNLVTLPEGLFNGLTKLESLDFTFNELVSVPEGIFSDLASLKTLSLYNNELTPETLPVGLFSGTPLLEEVSLGRNDLTDLTSLVGLFDGLTELTRLSISESGVRTVPDGLFAGLTKLENLSLSLNGLRSLPDGVFSDNTALDTLELTDNALTTVETWLSGLPDLRVLYLDFNDVELPEDVFAEFVNLEVLFINGCGLTTLPAGIFSPLVKLDRLEIEDNPELQCLPPNTVSFVFLDSEDARDGTCECTPVEAVFCDDGLTCQSGMAGYTCVAE